MLRTYLLKAGLICIIFKTAVAWKMKNLSKETKVFNLAESPLEGHEGL